MATEQPDRILPFVEPGPSAEEVALTALARFLLEAVRAEQRRADEPAPPAPAAGRRQRRAPAKKKG